MLGGDPLRGQEIANKILDRLIETRGRDGVVIYFDPDLDGLISGYFFAEFLRSYRINFKWLVNPNRQHGFLLSDQYVKNNLVGHTILSGDFTVSHATLKTLVNNHHISYLCSDHHENPDGYGEFYDSSTNALAVLMNNQFEGEPVEDHFQSGAGVVLDILSHYEPSMWNPLNAALVGMTLLSDVRDIESPRAKIFLRELYKLDFNSEHDFIRYFMREILKNKKSYGFGLPVMDRSFIDYTVAPALNSLFRWGKEKEAVKFILGEGYPNHDFHKDQKDLIALMDKCASVTEMTHLRLVSVSTESLDLRPHIQFVPSFVGVLASRHSEDKATLCYLEDEDGNVLRASFRGRFGGAEYLSHINDTGVALCKGHEAACGVSQLTPDPATWDLINEACSLAESNLGPDSKIYRIDSLKIAWNNGLIERAAQANEYRLSANFIKLEYTGSKAVKEIDKDNYQRWKIDGVQVTSFDQEVTPKNGVLVPTLSKGSAIIYLKPKV